jgi:hypothetical protein
MQWLVAVWRVEVWFGPIRQGAKGRALVRQAPVRLCGARRGMVRAERPVWSGAAGSGWQRLGQVRYGRVRNAVPGWCQDRLCQVGLGSVSLGKAWTGRVRSGLKRFGWLRNASLGYAKVRSGEVGCGFVFGGG